MLPDDVYHHYYDHPCEICQATINIHDDESSFCAECRKEMCEDCAHQMTCHICDDKIERDEDIDEIQDDCCEDCMEECKACDVYYHPKCRAYHKKVCNRNGRAKRALENANFQVRAGEAAVEIAKQQLARAERGLRAAKKAGKDAEKQFGRIGR